MLVDYKQFANCIDSFKTTASLAGSPIKQAIAIRHVGEKIMTLALTDTRIGAVAKLDITLEPDDDDDEIAAIVQLSQLSEINDLLKPCGYLLTSKVSILFDNDTKQLSFTADKGIKVQAPKKETEEDTGAEEAFVDPDQLMLNDEDQQFIEEAMEFEGIGDEDDDNDEIDINSLTDAEYEERMDYTRRKEQYLQHVAERAKLGKFTSLKGIEAGGSAAVNSSVGVTNSSVNELEKELLEEQASEEPEIIIKTVSHIERTCAFEDATDRRFAVLLNMDYDGMLNCTTGTEGTVDTLERVAVLDMFNKLLVEDDKNICISSAHDYISVANTQYTIYDTIKHLGLAYVIPVKSGRLICDVFKRYMTEETVKITRSNNFCVLAGGSARIAIWFNMGKPQQSILRSIEKYAESDYSDCIMVIIRDALINVIRSADKTVTELMFTVKKKSDGRNILSIKATDSAVKTDTFDVELSQLEGLTDVGSIRYRVSKDALKSMLNIASGDYIMMSVAKGDEAQRAQFELTACTKTDGLVEKGTRTYAMCKVEAT